HGAADRKAISGFIDKALAEGKAEPRDLQTSVGSALALAKPFTMMTPGQPVVLLLRYPLAQALGPYQALQELIAAIGFAGLLLVVAGSWMLARGVTQPISDLEEAAHRLENGEDAAVQVRSRDEIGRLSDSFNVMAGRIRERESELGRALDQ